LTVIVERDVRFGIRVENLGVVQRSARLQATPEDLPDFVDFPDRPEDFGSPVLLRRGGFGGAWQPSQQHGVRKLFFAVIGRGQRLIDANHKQLFFGQRVEQFVLQGSEFQVHGHQDQHVFG
jgi:hypothetical protein